MPHTLTFLVLGLSIILYFSIKSDIPDTPFIYNFQRSLIFSIVAFLLYAAIYFPDCELNRPHPVLWRLLQGAICFYAMIVVFILVVDLDTARQLLKYVDPRLGNPLPEKLYAIDCRIYTPENQNSKFSNITNALDLYVVCHWFGWWFKTVIFRDAYICIFLSITFEGLELSFKHWIPNFAECWWDSLIMDVLICNFIGIVLGVPFAVQCVLN